MKLRTFLQGFVLCALFIFGAGSVAESYGQDGSVAKAEKTIAKRRKKDAKIAKKEAKKAKKAFWDRQSKEAKKSIKRNQKRQKRAKRQSSGW
jgi:ATPase subunit of ABC transporter with duplicated ATPase domains